MHEKFATASGMPSYLQTTSSSSRVPRFNVHEKFATASGMPSYLQTTSSSSRVPRFNPFRADKWFAFLNKIPQRGRDATVEKRSKPYDEIYKYR